MIEFTKCEPSKRSLDRWKRQGKLEERLLGIDEHNAIVEIFDVVLPRITSDEVKKFKHDHRFHGLKVNLNDDEEVKTYIAIFKAEKIYREQNA